MVLEVSSSIAEFKYTNLLFELSSNQTNVVKNKVTAGGSNRRLMVQQKRYDNI